MSFSLVDLDTNRRILSLPSDAGGAARTESRGRSTVKTHPRLGQVARIDPATVRFDAPSAEGEAKSQAGSIGASLLERAEQFVEVFTRKTAAFVLDLDEHALGAAQTRSVTVVRGRVNLNAFCRRFPTAAARTCRSASIATPSSTGITASVMPRAFASNVAASASSSMNPDTWNCSRCWTAWVRRTSASERSMSARSPMRLRWSTPPVLPATPTFPVLRTSNAMTAVLIKFRNSWAKNPRRSFPRTLSRSSVD